VGPTAEIKKKEMPMRERCIARGWDSERTYKEIRKQIASLDHPIYQTEVSEKPKTRSEVSHEKEFNKKAREG